MISHPLFEFVLALKSLNDGFTFTSDMRFPNPGASQQNQGSAFVFALRDGGIGESAGEQFNVESQTWEDLITRLGNRLKERIPDLVLPWD